MFRIVKQIVQIKRIPFKEHWFLIDGSIIVILENNENILFLKIFYYFSSVTILIMVLKMANSKTLK